MLSDITISTESGFLVVNRKFKPTEYALINYRMTVLVLVKYKNHAILRLPRELCKNCIVLLIETEKLKAQLFELSQLIHILVQWKTSNVEDLLNYLNCDCLSNRIFTASNTEKHCIATLCANRMFESLKRTASKISTREMDEMCTAFVCRREVDVFGALFKLTFEQRV
ncbi:hypothetical protein T01_1812 [Trichinella spiralis]|uniref:Uncharacterized protein n=1 Tax=Trichinella spiralis TaxID=6334 RepID=A0A0V1BQT8_TRISP|nr:hypothetical protein T01_1812 [Trichinella spiralis]